MKRFITYFLLSCVVLFSSCTKWLEVQPASQISEDNQFSTEDGFKDALIGVYQKISARPVYGKELSFGLVDVLAQQYTNVLSTASHSYGYAGRYMYRTDANVEQKVNDIWTELYGAIAQVNLVLSHVDAKKDVFSGINYNLVKGESLALRAYLHFDLLRLFGKISPSGKGVQAIPYMKNFTVQPQASLTSGEVLAACMADLISAEELLRPDVELMRQPPSGDRFLAYRKNRFNYWAVKALSARVALYAGNTQLAFQQAKAVIEEGGFKFLTPENLNVSPTLIDRTASGEHIFAIYVSDLKLSTDEAFKTAALGVNSNNTFTISPSRKTELFTATSDIRIHPAFWANSQGIVYYSKLWQEDNSADSLRRRIPLIKLSEMYLLAAETAPSLPERITWFNALRDARIDLLLPANATETTLNAAIDMEYRKDFICEGQLFYYYKRKNVSVIPGAVTGNMSDDSYVLPKPVQEIEFGK